MEQVFLSLTKSDFQDLLAETFNSCLKRNNLQTLPPSEPQDELLTVQDTAKFLSLSVPTVYGLISKGELPVMKRSKRCYFSKIELINYLKAGKRKTVSEQDAETDLYLSSRKKRRAYHA